MPERARRGGGAVRGLRYDAIAYLGVNALLVVGWALFASTGSFRDVPTLLSNPDQAKAVGFFPVYLIYIWGVALATHALIVILATPARHRRRARARAQRRRERRDAATAAATAAMSTFADRAAAAANPEPVVAWEPRDLPRERRWVAVMFTDIVESTALNEELGDETWSELLAAHRSTVRETVASHEGIEVGTQGDSFFVRFDGPDDAADCATHLQQLLAKHRADDDLVPHVRVGLHAGEVVRHDDDLVGRVVNLAARVMATADADEILLTEPLADHLSRTHGLVDRGLCSLKGFDQPRHLLALRWELDDHPAEPVAEPEG